ncbi:MAG: metalloregulator ArsR/SmtB family transcription factor [Thermodesulfobacteriota bacterium]|nr:metalloregulator ArsR/SmtB family transcription factor [Thermodesulfobacteriota bacterium]
MRSLQSIFKALSNETRIRILKLISQRELCVCELMQVLDMTQSRISRHVNLLKQAGLVKDRRDGKWVYYSIDAKSFNPYAKDILGLFYGWLNNDKVVKMDLKNLSKAKRLSETNICCKA